MDFCNLPHKCTTAAAAVSVLMMMLSEKSGHPSATASYYCRRTQQQQPTIASPPLYLVALRLLCSFWMVKGERAEPRSPTLAVCSLKQSNGADHSGIVVWDYVWSFVVFLAQTCSDLSRLLIFSYFPKSTMFCISISEKKIFHFPHHLLLCLLRLWACHKQCSTVWVNERVRGLSLILLPSSDESIIHSCSSTRLRAEFPIPTTILCSIVLTILKRLATQIQ